MNEKRHLRLANEYDTPSSPIEVPKKEHWRGEAVFTLKAETVLSAAIISSLSRAFESFDGSKPGFAIKDSTLFMSVDLEDNSQSSYDKLRAVIAKVIEATPNISVDFSDICIPILTEPVPAESELRSDDQTAREGVRIVPPID